MNDKLLGPLSRRRLIAAAGLAFTGTAAGAAPALALSGKSRSPGRPVSPSLQPLAHAGVEAWSQQVGSSFRVATESGVRTLKLTEVRPLDELAGRDRKARRNRAFAAVFEAVGGPLPSGGRIYPVSHASGTFDIFFGPAGETLVAIFA